MRIKKSDPAREPTFQDLLEICKEADAMVSEIRKFPKAQGKKPSNLKVAIIHYLAEKKKINLTLHHLYLIYGKVHNTIYTNKKLIKGLLEHRKS